MLFSPNLETLLGLVLTFVLKAFSSTLDIFAV